MRNGSATRRSATTERPVQRFARLAHYTSDRDESEFALIVGLLSYAMLGLIAIQISSWLL